MSLRPPLHVSTFHSRTVVSMFGRLCHLFVRALSSLQVANAQCMTLRSLAPCLRAAREKHRFAAGKKHRNGKYTFAAGKNRLAAGKSCLRSGKKRQQKMPLRSGKNSKQQKKHLAAAQKHLCSRKMHFGGSGKKPVRGKKKTGRGRKKTSSRESPALQPKKLPQRKKYISATGKSSSPKPEFQVEGPRVGGFVHPERREAAAPAKSTPPYLSRTDRRHDARTATQLLPRSGHQSREAVNRRRAIPPRTPPRGSPKPLWCRVCGTKKKGPRSSIV